MPSCNGAGGKPWASDVRMMAMNRMTFLLRRESARAAVRQDQDAAVP